MSDPLFDRLSTLRLQLASHVRLYPQTYRGDRWFVLANEAAGRYLRFNASAYAAIGRFDGNITLADLHALLETREGSPSKQELAEIVLQLDGIDALQGSLPEDVQALTGQHKADRRAKAAFNPLSVRFKLFDPDAFLDATMPWVRPLFSTTSAALWLAVIVLAAVLGILHIGELGAAINSSLLSPLNLALAWLVFSAMKIVHEFAHAYSVKRWGGEVHEMGISLLVLMPVPYVDASASWAFRSKYRRAFVGAAGILVELFIAALALLIFLAVEPGLVRNIALNAMLIGGLSTLLVNGNPLLRFDGYHVLQDLAELPNLSTRSSAFLSYWAKRNILRIEDCRSPVMAHGEVSWLAGYGVAAGIYRLFVLAVIGLFLASEFLAVGVALLTWAVLMQIALPAARAMHFLATDQRLRGRRPLAMLRVALIPAAILLAIAVIPVSHTTQSQGIVWLPDQSQIYARSDGFITSVAVQDGATLVPGDVIASLSNDDLALRRIVLKARARELVARRNAEQFANRTASSVAGEEYTSVQAEIARLDEQLGALTVTSPTSGRFVHAMTGDLQGRFVRQGELLGYVVAPADLIVRAVLPQRDIGRLRDGVTGVRIRLAEYPANTLDAQIVRETPGGNIHLPSRALGRPGGGDIETDALDRDALRATGKVFEIDLALPQGTTVSGIGGRAYVQYLHPSAPLLQQWMQRLRQLLLRRLNF